SDLPGKLKMAKEQLRQMHCEFNTLSRCDGSVMYSQGASMVIAAILGPVEVKTQNLSNDGSYLECNYRPKAGLPQIKERLREAAVKDVLDLAVLVEPYPRSRVSLQLQEIEDRGSMDACAVNSACLAMLIGGLPLKCSFAAVHCIIDEQGDYVLDPDQSECLHQQAGITFVFDSVEGNLMLLQAKGAFKISQFNDIECLCRAASEEIFKFYRSQITHYHARSQEIKEQKSMETT
ncbi:hypothetical protein KR018_000676, partial [Drosophila ironensis]